MAGSSVANSSSILNLSRRQTVLLQEIILAGGEMSQALIRLDDQFCLPGQTVKPAQRWLWLMMQFAKSLL
ncbi:MAG: hypothetical protein EPO11_07620 [Gammaproteobacteria bacterium]|nr:MAG: hypothetical protein EPO11_07620 [Gammaproteobacteria bacterium]